MKHLVEVVSALLGGRVDVPETDGVPVLVVIRGVSIDYLPTIDDVYAVVALVAKVSVPGLCPPSDPPKKFPTTWAIRAHP